MKKLIVVQGNQDGILGVFTNKKLAYECAKDYCEGGAENTLNMTYSKFCKEMTSSGWISLDGDGYVSAICSTFIQNQY